MAKRGRKKKILGDPNVILLDEYNEWKKGDVATYTTFRDDIGTGEVSFFRNYDHLGMVVMMWDLKYEMYKSGFADSLSDKAPPKKKRKKQIKEKV